MARDAPSALTIPLTVLNVLCIRPDDGPARDAAAVRERTHHRRAPDIPSTPVGTIQGGRTESVLRRAAGVREDRLTPARTIPWSGCTPSLGPVRPRTDDGVNSVRFASDKR